MLLLGKLCFNSDKWWFLLGNMVFLSSPELFSQAYDAGKFSWGLSDFSFDKRTIWVMIIYGLTENLRNLLADQNYVQKYATVQNNEEAAKSMKLATIIYLFLTVCFLFIGTALFYFYQIQTFFSGSNPRRFVRMLTIEISPIPKNYFLNSLLQT